MYDVVIVGAGTAGCVLAAELTREGGRTVALVEAGGEPANRFIAIPAGFTRLFKSEVDWNLESEPQSAARGARIYTPRGRMLGGSSNMNAQVHQWCHPADFAGWVAAGAHGWGWQDVAPVFRAQERWLGDDDDPRRGRDGPMTVSPNHHARPLSYAFVESARAAGLGAPPHYNGGAYAGAWLCELAVRDGRRFSCYDAFLKGARGRRSLELITDAHATRVAIQDGRATGVVVRQDGVERTLEAGAVVLAAGAFGSPQLLMSSGIGPADALRALGIQPLHAAPDVGANLQDHPVAGPVFTVRGRDTLKSAESLPSLLDYLLRRRGMLASNGVEAFAFAQVEPGPAGAPDLELMFLPFEHRPHLLEPPQVHACTIAAAVVAPRSRGRLWLRSPDPLEAPAFDFGLFTDPDGVDRRVFLAGLRMARRIAATAPLSGAVTGERRPGPEVQSDAELFDSMCPSLQTVYHPSGTCRMGSDARAVVDPQLRVRGIERLWVADASVMPSVPRGHPNAVVAMIAGRAAGWIGAATDAAR
jgi:choline dehydrogenase